MYACRLSPGERAALLYLAAHALMTPSQYLRLLIREAAQEFGKPKRLLAQLDEERRNRKGRLTGSPRG
jgi:hypothetical protein